MSDHDVVQITDQRGSTYGPFVTNGRLAQGIKTLMRTGPAWQTMPDDVREALDLIATKISRIATGAPEHLDSWLDISGYAHIVAKRIRTTTTTGG